MKLASLRAQGRDGELVVVSRDGTKLARARDIAPTMQAALDDWPRARPLLEERYRLLMAGSAKSEPFDVNAAHSPLPRAYQWLDGGAYPAHRDRMTGGKPMPEWFKAEPSMYQGGSDGFLAPTEDVPAASEDWGIDFEAEVAVITDFVPYATREGAAAAHIALVLLVNDVSLRNLQGTELQRGFGFVHAKPASSFSPLAVTPDELGADWRDTRLHLPLACHVNGALFGDPDAGVEMSHNFDRLVAYCARTRSLAAGSIVGAGTVSVGATNHGHCCIAERRALEQQNGGTPRTPYLRFGDRVRIEMLDADGHSIFGAIDQKVVQAG